MQAQDLGQSGKRLTRGAMGSGFFTRLNRRIEITLIRKRRWKAFRKAMALPRSVMRHGGDDDLA